MFDEFEHEVMCTVCMSGLSEPPNEIVLCDCCNSGYHQASGFIKTTLWLHNWDCLSEIGGMTETKTFCHILLLKGGGANAPKGPTHINKNCARFCFRGGR